MRSLRSSFLSNQRASRQPRRNAPPPIRSCRAPESQPRGPRRPRWRAPGTAWIREAPLPRLAAFRRGSREARNPEAPGPRRTGEATGPARRGSLRTPGSLPAVLRAVGCILQGLRALFELDPLVNLLAVNLDTRRRVDPQLHVIPLHLDDRDFHVVTDSNVFAEFSGQEEHRALCRSPASCRRGVSPADLERRPMRIPAGPS